MNTIDGPWRNERYVVSRIVEEVFQEVSHPRERLIQSKFFNPPILLYLRKFPLTTIYFDFPFCSLSFSPTPPKGVYLDQCASDRVIYTVVVWWWCCPVSQSEVTSFGPKKLVRMVVVVDCGAWGLLLMNYVVALIMFRLVGNSLQLLCTRRRANNSKEIVYSSPI